jgi:signal transduction histidine kinase
MSSTSEVDDRRFPLSLRVNMQSKEELASAAALSANIHYTSELSHRACRSGDVMFTSSVVGAIVHPLAPSLPLTLSPGWFAAGPREVSGPLGQSDTTLGLEGREAAGDVLAGQQDKDPSVAILIHELRTPLATLTNVAEVLKGERLDASVMRQVAGIIDRQVRAMTRLVEDVLDRSEVCLGHLELKLTIVDISQIIENGVENIRPLVEARGHTLTASLPSEPMFIEADAFRLWRALQNLLDNAVKYSDAGGQIRVGLEHDGQEAVVRVSDTGIGIEPAQLDAIFELYAQAGQEGTKRAAQGLGMGLYLARRLIEAHGGSIRAHSAGPGYGSEFTVRLPRSPSEPLTSPS